MQKRIRRLTALSVALGAAVVTGFGLAAPAQAASSGSISLELASSHSPTALDTEVFAGKTSKRYSGERVVLQTRNRKHPWYDLRSSKVKSDGTFTIRTRALGLGRTPYRVVLDATSKHALVASDSTYAVIYNFFYVSRLPSPYTYSGQNFYSSPTTIAGHLYPNSLLMGNITGASNADSIDVNISYKCTSFQATVGVDDSGYSGASGTATVEMDGGSLGTTTIGLGVGRPISYDITKGFRIRLTGGNNNPGESTGIPIGWGDARILCSGKPSQPKT